MGVTAESHDIIHYVSLCAQVGEHEIVGERAKCVCVCVLGGGENNIVLILVSTKFY